jgi:hypothetical protein
LQRKHRIRQPQMWQPVRITVSDDRGSEGEQRNILRNRSREIVKSDL